MKSYDDLKEKTLGMTGFFETSQGYPACYGVTSGNHDGAGLSHGVLQFNFGTGSLQPLWSYMIDNFPTLCQDIFGVDYDTWVDVVKNRTTADQVAWGDSISTGTDKRGIAEPWNTYFQTLGETPESIAKQITYSDSWRPNAEKWFDTLGLFSRRAYALLWDISVQMGRLFPLNQIIQDFNTIDPTGKTRGQIEEEKLYKIVNRCTYDNRVSPSVQSIVYDRKVMLVDGIGDYYGTPFDITQYDLGYEPAFKGGIFSG